MVLGNPPPELKAITPFVQRAKELTSIYPLISYYCLLQAANDGIKENVKNKDCHNYLKELFDELELRKKNLSSEGSINSEENMAKAKLQITNLALNSFRKADEEDRSGNASKKTARTFHASSTFFEVLQCFGALDKDIEKKIKYAKWKAADIMKAIREGRTPTPGSPVSSKNELEDELPSSNSGLNLSSPSVNNDNQNFSSMNDNFGHMNINDPTNYGQNPQQFNPNSQQYDNNYDQNPQQFNPNSQQYDNNYGQNPQQFNNNNDDELNNLMNEMSPMGGSMNMNNNMNNMNSYSPTNFNQNGYNNFNNGAPPPALPPRQQNPQNPQNPQNGYNQGFNIGGTPPMLPPRVQQQPPIGGFDESMFPTTPTNNPGGSSFSSSSNINSSNSLNNGNNSPYGGNGGSPYNRNSNSNNNSGSNTPVLPTVPKNTFKEDPFASSNSLDEDSYSDDEIDYPYDPAVLMDAQKHSRFAVSALQYDDVPTAIKELRIALKLLEPYQNIQQPSRK